MMVWMREFRQLVTGGREGIGKIRRGQRGLMDEVKTTIGDRGRQSVGGDDYEEFGDQVDVV